MKWWVECVHVSKLTSASPSSELQRSGLRSFLKVVDVPRHRVYTPEVVGGMGGLGPGRSGGPTGSSSACRKAAQHGRNLQARVKPTDCSQW